MNPPSILLVFSLMIPSLLHSKSQGIRIDEWFSKDTQLQHQLQNNGCCHDDEVNPCNQVQNYHSTSGRKAKTRKLLISTSISISRTHITSKKAKTIENNREGEETKVNWMATYLKKHEVVDIAEMDYTAATKKPPIHN